MTDTSILRLILLNAYYIGVAIAFLIKEILWLRLVMIMAGLCMITQGILAGNGVIIGWISLFTVINTVQVIRILHERREIKLAPEDEFFYEKIFSDMTRKEFLIFWQMGESRTLAREELLCEDDRKLDAILLIIKGQARVEKKGKPVAELGVGSFVAEMSYLTGLNPSADVRAISEAEVKSWSFARIHRLKGIYPILYNKLQLVLSKDLTHKLKKYL